MSKKIIMYGIKPCPFCGDEFVSVENYAFNRFKVSCGQCGASISSKRYATKGADEAVTKWNKRECENNAIFTFVPVIVEEDELTTLEEDVRKEMRF